MDQGPDFWCWFDTTQFSYHCVHPIHAKMFSIQMLLHFSQIVQRVCTLVLFILYCNRMQRLHVYAFQKFCSISWYILERINSWDIITTIFREIRKSSPWIYPTYVFFYGFFLCRTFTPSLKITGEKHSGSLGVGECIAQRAVPWCLVLNPTLCMKSKPWGLLLKNIAKLAGGLLLDALPGQLHSVL